MEDMNIKVQELNFNINMEPVEIFNQYYGTDLEFQPIVGKVQNNEFIPFSNEEFKEYDSLIPSHLEVRLKQR